MTEVINAMHISHVLGDFGVEKRDGFPMWGRAGTTSPTRSSRLGAYAVKARPKPIVDHVIHRQPLTKCFLNVEGVAGTAGQGR